MNKIVILFCFIVSLQSVFADYNTADGLEYVYASSLAYCDPSNVQSWTCGAACQNLTGYQPFYSNTFQLAIDQTLAFSMIYNPSSKKFITVFRGTVGNLELLSEILEDSPVAYQLSNISNAEVLKYFYNHYSNDLRPTFVQKLQEFYSSNQDYRFVFSGHSLGAALTTLAAFDTVTSGYISSDKVTLYNYGSPRVGNYAFAKAVVDAIPIIYRIVHWNDLIPHVPPCITDSSGNCVSNNSDSNMQDSALIWPAWHVSQEIFYDKACVNYQTCVGSEDPNCADQFQLVGTTMAQHYYYLTVPMDCDGESVIKASSLTEGITTEQMLFEAKFMRGW